MLCQQFVAFMCNEVGHTDPFDMMLQSKSSAHGKNVNI